MASGITITDQKFAQEIKDEWTGVFRHKNGTVFSPHHGHLIPPPYEIVKLKHNIALLLAYGVLERVLLYFKTSGLLACGRTELGCLMKSSKTAINWSDYSVVDDGRKKRNDLAHQAKLLAPQDVNKYITAIQVNLKTWALIS
ncbi:MAG: hypothetical protein HQL16_01345 [Candidatus Omnitrophica bacterium]|nr:hypothetical protein [Candidatus Omnitrophota bacterium]